MRRASTISKPQHDLARADSTYIQSEDVPFEAASKDELLHPRHSRKQLPSPSPSPRSASPLSPLSDDERDPRHPQGVDVIPEQSPPHNLVAASHSDAWSHLASTAGVPAVTLQEIPEEQIKSRRLSSDTKALEDKALKLSAVEIEALTSAPESLPSSSATLSLQQNGATSFSQTPQADVSISRDTSRPRQGSLLTPQIRSLPSAAQSDVTIGRSRPTHVSRTISTPVTSRQDSSWSSGARNISPARRGSHTFSSSDAATMASINNSNSSRARKASDSDIDIAAHSIPLPPMSIPTYLQLELASTRPSPLYIYRPTTSEYPYESSRVKFERLLHFLLLPPQLEQVLFFGALACLDAWLSTFTILPLRFVKACTILVQWWTQVLVREARFITGFIWHGVGRMWHRQRERGRGMDSASQSRDSSRSSRPSISTNPSYIAASRIPEVGTAVAASEASERLKQFKAEIERKSGPKWGRRHRRSKSQPSTLSPLHKADILNGLVIIASSMVLMSFDASRMYHSIRGQSAMKLYVLYNLLEVVDRLLAALGQDILECLVSDETLGRGEDGRSKIMRPFGMFVLALVYNVLHAASLFYQVITLNVAVNSYSNALLSLLMSNQFVEIKSTVFKKFEKENLFQLTCADVVERFQLWLMLVIIGLRNVVEVGGLTVAAAPEAAAEAIRNTTIPIRSNSILPDSFTILPVWTGEVLSPFLIVLGSEMLVDWVKHAYISKFNSVKPAVYQKYLDVLAKDYYTNAFVNQNLIKRLGLPVIPLSCLFIRASVQTYHMFLATHLSMPLPSTATSLSLDNIPGSEPTATAAALERFDSIIRMALGRSTFGTDGSLRPWYSIGTDDLIASATFILFFLVVYMVALLCKLVLGMVLLAFARNRYRDMKKREHMSIDTKGKRLGGWGMIEVDDEKKKIIYEDDADGFRAMKDRERKQAEKERAADKKGVDFEQVTRYEMAAKRIW